MTLRKSVLKALQFAGEKIGLSVIPEWKMDSYAHTERLKRIISEYQIDCILDVGANIGQFRDFLRNHLDYEGLIISFEPDPDNFKVLNKRLNTDSQWIAFEYALGKEKKTLDFNIMKSSVLNSFLEPNPEDSSRTNDNNSIVETIKVETKRLDDIIDEIKKDHHFNNLFLKMDTQGFDLEVFEGAFGCIDQIRGVQTEVTVMPIYKDMPSFEDSLKLFKSKGFEVSGLYALSESRFPHAIEFDCIYLPK